ncbi:MAG: hypothetical protein M1820_006003 [Bogoriella megaspora]|nr:MAG: hypothetical protein M1820_006003 [Bogoriella megaspora]
MASQEMEEREVRTLVFLGNHLEGQDLIKIHEGPRVEVIVGLANEEETRETIVIPYSLLSHHSKYFREARRTPTVLENDPQIFEYFVQYIYCGSYQCTMIGTPGSELFKSFEGDHYEAWILGDRLGAPHFQNHVLDHLVGHHKRGFVAAGSIDIIYKNTSPGSRIRKFFAACVRVAHGRAGFDPSTWESTGERAGEFLSDLQRLLSIPIGEFRDPFEHTGYYYEDVMGRPSRDPLGPRRFDHLDKRNVTPDIKEERMGG